MAGVLAAGDGAVLGRRSSLSLWGLWNGRRASPRCWLRAAGGRGPVLVLTYRRLDPADVTVLKGIPVTTVARTSSISPTSSTRTSWPT